MVRALYFVVAACLNQLFFVSLRALIVSVIQCIIVIVLSVAVTLETH